MATFDINQYIQAMLQLSQQQQQGRLQNNRESMSGRHLGMGGGDMTEANPTGDARNPFGSGFFNSSAAQMSPEARLASQGNNAMNQWGQQGGLDGINQQALIEQNSLAGGQQRMNPMMPQDRAMTASAASPQPYKPNPEAFQQGWMPQPLTSPQGNAQSDQANFQQNLMLARHPLNFQQPPQATFMNPAAPQQEQPQQPMPKKRPGFGATARPGSSFSFGGGMR